MKIELKNIKTQETLSNMTFCYAADIFVNDKYLGVVSNLGGGVKDDFQGDYKNFAQVKMWVKENLPRIYSLSKDSTMDMTFLCQNIIENHVIKVSLEDNMKESILFKPVAGRKVYWHKPNGARQIEPEHISDFTSKHPKYKVLNTLPLKEAFAIFKESYNEQKFHQ
ncbi:MAG: hypothetical protein ACJAS1_000539 [Oleiphilaceae bacterium]|jgi:hypothetical protein